MLGKPGQKHDVAIWWSANVKRLRRVIRTGRCPSHATPLRAREPGAVVCLADRAGKPTVVFRLARIERNTAGIGANGKRFTNGCVLVAQPRSARWASGADPARVPINPHGIGAPGYFNSKKSERVVYDVSRAGTVAAPVTASITDRRYRFLANNVAKTLSQPERNLLRAYECWIGTDDFFEHRALPERGLYTDLFIRPSYTLVEAKATINRWAIRTAIGQLFDYQRYFADRHPSLAVLLPREPPPNMRDLLRAKRIRIIWRTSGRSFTDSEDGALTSELRERALTTQ
jgi:hypothetical protein